MAAAVRQRVAASALALGAILAGCPAGHPGAADAGLDAGPVCHSRADCPGGQICSGVDGGPGGCLACTTNGQCRPQESCNPATHACAFLPGWGDQCVLNGDCPLGELCQQGLCAAPSQVTVCTRNSCPTGERCNIPNQVCEQDLGCFSDADCPPAEACNPGSRACVPSCTAATAAQVCDPAQRCVGGICVDCTRDADCGPGLTCDIAAGRCGGVNACYSDGDCPAGELCNLATQACGPRPPPCASNDDCPATEVCEPSTGRCIAASCQPDVFDPNGNPAQAAPIQAGLSYSALTLCSPSEQDWYSIGLQSGDRIQVTIDANTTGAGYSFLVQLRAADGAILASGNLVLDATVPQGGGYFLRMTDGDAQANYGFSVLVSHGTPCPTDPFDPNGSAAQAAPLDGGSVGPIWLCAGQADWYEAALPSGSSLTATLGCDPSQGPLGLTLLDGDGTTILGQDNRGLSTETVTATHSSGGRVFLEVTGDGQDSNAYTLSLADSGG